MVAALKCLLRPTAFILPVLLLSLPISGEAQRKAATTAYQTEAESLITISNTICASRFISVRSKVATAMSKFKSQFGKLKSGMGSIVTSLGATITSLGSLPNDVPKAFDAFGSCVSGSGSLSVLKQMPKKFDDLAKYYQSMKNNASDLFSTDYDDIVDRASDAVATELGVQAGKLGSCLKNFLGVADLTASATAAQAEIKTQMAQLTSLTSGFESAFNGGFTQCLSGLSDLSGASITFTAPTAQAAWAGFAQCFINGAGGTITGNLFAELELNADAFSKITPLTVLDELGSCVITAGEKIYDQVNPIGTIRVLRDAIASLGADFANRIQAAIDLLTSIFSPSTYDWSGKDDALKRACKAFKAIQ